MNYANILKTKILDGYGIRTVTGDYGIEIEVEGEGLPDVILGWKVVADHSLRGESAEYVSIHPYDFDKVPAHLDIFKLTFSKNYVKVHESIRTSVHVHRNVQQYTILQVLNIITAYMLIENLLVRYSGNTRENNLFCLRVSDAEMFVHDLCDSIQRGTFFNNFQERHRYSALNLAAISKFNSLEFRSMRGTTDVDLILKWVNIIESLVTNAVEMAHPDAILQEYIDHGPDIFIKKYTTDDFFNWVKSNIPNYSNLMDENVHYLIKISIAYDWHNELIPKNNIPAKDMFKKKNVLFERNPALLIEPGQFWQAEGLLDGDIQHLENIIIDEVEDEEVEFLNEPEEGI